MKLTFREPQRTDRGAACEFHKAQKGSVAA
jgi:hypothetical protein